MCWTKGTLFSIVRFYVTKKANIPATGAEKLPQAIPYLLGVVGYFCCSYFSLSSGLSSDDCLCGK